MQAVDISLSSPILPFNLTFVYPKPLHSFKLASHMLLVNTDDNAFAILNIIILFSKWNKVNPLQILLRE